MGCHNFGQGVQLLLHWAGGARTGRGLLFHHLCVLAERSFSPCLTVLQVEKVSGVSGDAFLLCAVLEPVVLRAWGAGTGGGLGG